MNSPFAIEQATFLAGRTDAPGVAGVEPQASPQITNAAANRVRRINRLFRLTLGRQPALDEVTDALEFIDGGDPAALENIQSQLTWQFGWGTVDEPAPAPSNSNHCPTSPKTPGKVAARAVRRRRPPRPRRREYRRCARGCRVEWCAWPSVFRPAAQQ